MTPERSVSFSVRVRLFTPLNDSYILNRSYVNDHTPSGIQVDVQYLATSLHDPAILFSCYKRIYKFKPLNSPPSEPLCFYPPFQIFIYLLEVYKDIFEGP